MEEYTFTERNASPQIEMLQKEIEMLREENALLKKKIQQRDSILNQIFDTIDETYACRDFSDSKSELLVNIRTYKVRFQVSGTCIINSLLVI